MFLCGIRKKLLFIHIAYEVRVHSIFASETRFVFRLGGGAPLTTRLMQGLGDLFRCSFSSGGHSGGVGEAESAASGTGGESGTGVGSPATQGAGGALFQMAAGREAAADRAAESAAVSKQIDFSTREGKAYSWLVEMQTHSPGFIAAAIPTTPEHWQTTVVEGRGHLAHTLRFAAPTHTFAIVLASVEHVIAVGRNGDGQTPLLRDQPLLQSSGTILASAGSQRFFASFLPVQEGIQNKARMLAAGDVIEVCARQNSSEYGVMWLLRC